MPLNIEYLPYIGLYWGLITVTQTNRIAILNTLEPFTVLLMSFIVLKETMPNITQSIGDDAIEDFKENREE